MDRLPVTTPVSHCGVIILLSRLNEAIIPRGSPRI
jgi:hypothetical protein